MKGNMRGSYQRNVVLRTAWDLGGVRSGRKYQIALALRIAQNAMK